MALKQLAAARQQFNCRTDFQERYHLLNPTEEEVETGLDIRSQIGATQPRESWMSAVDENMLSRSASNSHLQVYEVNSNFHILRYVRLCATLPTVRVYETYRDNIQICWPENIGHQIIRKATLYHGQKSAGNLDNVWLDNNMELFVSNKDHYDRMIGNIPCLREWSFELPAYDLTIPQPFYFSAMRAFAIRLFQCKKTQTTFTYDFRLKLSELLCMRKKQSDGSWKRIRFRPEYIEGKQDFSLNVPYLLGRYGLLTSQEISQFLERHPDESVEEFKKKNSFYIDDIECINSSNPVGIGESIDIDVSDIKKPVKGVVITAQNIDAQKQNNRSNYTTDQEIENGWNPVSAISVLYSRDTNLENEPGHRLSLDYPYYCTPAHPRRPGTNLFCTDAISLGSCGTTLNFSKLGTSFRVTVDDTDPRKRAQKDKRTDPRDNGKQEDIDDEEEEKSDPRSFAINFRIITIKKIKYTSDSCHVIETQEEDDSIEDATGDDVAETDIRALSVQSS